MAHMKRILRVGGASLVLALCAAPARAEPWEGLWAEDQAYCGTEVGAQEDSPHRYTRQMFTSFDSACEVRTISPIRGMKAWMVELSCAAGGGGSALTVRELLMVTEDGALVRFTGDGYLFRMVRCK